jgi:hypothetical protein
MNVSHVGLDSREPACRETTASMAVGAMRPESLGTTLLVGILPSLSRRRGTVVAVGYGPDEERPGDVSRLATQFPP